jgi:hypothetical protein
VTHRFSLDEIDEAFDLFSHQRDGVLKVALYPELTPTAVRAKKAGAGAIGDR